MEATILRSAQPPLAEELERGLLGVERGLIVIEAGNGVDGDPVSRLAAMYEGGDLSNLVTSSHSGRLAVPHGEGFRMETTCSYDEATFDVIKLMSHFFGLNQNGREDIAFYTNYYDTAVPVMTRPRAELFVGYGACRGSLTKMVIEEGEDGPTFGYKRFVLTGKKPGNDASEHKTSFGFPGVPTMAGRTFGENTLAH